MDFKEYEKAALRTQDYSLGPNSKLLLAGIGIAGEAGEFAELVKKERFHQKTIPNADFIKEMGDILWYMALACEALGVSLEDVARANVEKLARRYPEGFSHDAANNRTE